MSEDGLKMFSFRDRKPEDHELLENSARTPSRSKRPSPVRRPTRVDLRRPARAEYFSRSCRRGATAARRDVRPESRKAFAIVVAMYESARNGGAAVDVSN
jgi:hypothetical protein